MLKVLSSKMNKALFTAPAPTIRNAFRFISPTMQPTQNVQFRAYAYQGYEDEVLDASSRRSSQKMSLQDLQVGQQLQGTVKSLVAFGCFVDVGATSDGLVHISQLTDGFVKDVADVVQVGDQVSVRVLSVEGDKRLSLTMKTGEQRTREDRPRRERSAGRYDEDQPRGYDRASGRESRYKDDGPTNDRW